jgi:hypothetical protein
MRDHLWRCGESAIQHHVDPWQQALELEAGGSCPDQEAKAKCITTTQMKRWWTYKSNIGKPKSSILTSGGRHSSAWRRSTEKPPCVLVSEAVNVLQNECTRGLAGAAAGTAGISSPLEAFSSCCYTQNQQMKHFETHCKISEWSSVEAEEILTFDSGSRVSWA